MKAFSFRATLGITSGYGHNNEDTCTWSLEDFGNLWQLKAEQVFKSSDIYVSCTVSLGKAVYNEEWGCPKGGEDVFIIQGELNPEFNEDLYNLGFHLYKKVVIELLGLVAKELKQSTTQVTFQESDFVYIKLEQDS